MSSVTSGDIHIHLPDDMTAGEATEVLRSVGVIDRINESWRAGAALASALMAANYGGDSGEDVDRLIEELSKRGYVLRRKSARIRPARLRETPR